MTLRDNALFECQLNAHKHEHLSTSAKLIFFCGKIEQASPLSQETWSIEKRLSSLCKTICWTPYFPGEITDVQIREVLFSFQERAHTTRLRSFVEGDLRRTRFSRQHQGASLCGFGS